MVEIGNSISLDYFLKTNITYLIMLLIKFEIKFEKDTH